MDREHRKKMQTLRLMITEAIMVITVVVLVVVLTFVAMGYKVNEEGKLDQAGLVQIRSFPTGATVTIDDEIQFAKTNTSKLLSAGSHNISYTRDGYDTWQKTIQVRSGWLYKADYGRIFAINRPIEQVKSFKSGLEFITASPDQNSLLYTETDSFDWKWMNISGDEVNTYSIDTFKHLLNRADLEKAKKDETKFTGIVQEVRWNSDSNKVLIKFVQGESIVWALIDLRNPDSSLNLSDSFSMDFENIRFATESGDRLYAIENGHLRSISVSNKEISRVLLSDVVEFSNNKNSIMVVTKSNDGKYIKIFEDGEKEPVTLKKAESDNIKVGLTEYLGKKIWSFVDGEKVFVYEGDYNNEGLKKMAQLVADDLGFIPDSFELHGENQFLVAHKGNMVAVYDAELKEINKFDIAGNQLVWISRHMVASFADGYIVLSDFDGANVREQFAPAIEGYTAVITDSGKWLYYINNDETSGVVINRQKLIV